MQYISDVWIPLGCKLTMGGRHMHRTSVETIDYRTQRAEFIVMFLICYKVMALFNVRRRFSCWVGRTFLKDEKWASLHVCGSHLGSICIEHIFE